MAEAARKKPGAPRKYPWDEMEIGDRFLVEGKTVYQFTGALQYANSTRAPKRFSSKTRVPGLLVIERVK